MKPLSSPLQQYWQTVVERLPEPLAEESLSAQAKSVLTFSDFVQDSVIVHPEWLTELESQPPQADEWQHYAAWLQEALSNVSDEAGLMRELRLFRRRIMVRIAWAQTLALVTEERLGGGRQYATGDARRGLPAGRPRFSCVSASANA
jgi:[glutamine synthetase] adenylyltransferase / [glutamine synthetase]-adenylyl-L-tyrosine phosphorylase